MKKIVTSISFFTALFLSGCSESFIDLSPTEQAANLYKTAEDMELAVNASYYTLKYNGQYNLAMHEIAEVRSDNTHILDAQSGANLVQIDAFTTISNNATLNTMWTDHYRGIQQCNIVIGRIGGVPMDQSLKNRFEGEVKFLRALMYFNLVRTFGAVPLVLKEITKASEGYEYGRETVDNVYQQIGEDLQDAAGKLPPSYSGADLGRATSGAAKTLLAKVHLTRHEYDPAIVQLREVTSSGLYRLLDSYADLFKITNENHPESIFEIQYKKGGLNQGSPFHNQFAPRNSGLIVTKVGQAHGFNIPTQDMEDAYEAGDMRKSISMAGGYMDGNNFVPLKHVTKYIDTPFQQDDADNNWPVLRYADVLLMLAECLNEKGYVADGEAFDLLNSIRQRAGLPVKTSGNAVVALKIANQEAFRLAIEQERRVELAFENHRWFDLVRTGRALDVMNVKGFNIEAVHLLFPVPQSQIDINPSKIKQNPGYN